MDSRVEQSLINKHIRQHNREVGEVIYWFEFDPGVPLYPGSTLFPSSSTVPELPTYDDVYDEGAPGDRGRRYAGGLAIPTIYVEEIEDQFTLQDDGRQVTQNISVTLLYKDVEAAGVSDPAEYGKHLNDIFYYDNRYYKVWEYRVRGRLPDEILVAVRGFEVFVDQEFPFDPGPPTIQAMDLPWPSTFPAVSV
jgi:hypothetical protein